MRESDVDLDAEVIGTSYRDTLEVNAWRGGELVAEHLDVLSWSLGWDATRQVQGQLSIVFADPDGTLAPWTLSDALAPGGSQLQVTWRSGSTEAEVPVGWYRIRKGDPREEWRLVQLPKSDGPPEYRAKGENVASNPSFDKNLDFWYFLTADGYAAGTMDRDTNRAHSGSGSMRITTGTDPVAVITSFPLTAGVRYRISAWVYVASGGPDVGIFAPSFFNGPTVTSKDVWVYTETNWVSDRSGVFAGIETRGDVADGSQFWIDQFDVRTTKLAGLASTQAWIPGGGGQIAVDADDLTCIPADLDRLDAEPVVESMTLAEVSRLLDDVIPVAFDETITDLPVPSSLVYEDGRMDAVEDHLSRVHAVYRMSGAGELEVIPEDGSAPVWTLRGGNDGVLISLARSMTDDGIYNAAISSAEPDYGDSGEDPIQLVGRDYILDGPLEWGPGTAFGRVPIFHQSPAKTQFGVDADARTLLANRQKTATAELSVECLLHPALQIYDRVTLVPPSTEEEYPIVGVVTSMQIAGTDVIEKRMTLGVTVTADVLEALASKARSRVHD